MGIGITLLLDYILGFRGVWNGSKPARRLGLLSVTGFVIEQVVGYMYWAWLSQFAHPEQKKG